MAISGGKWVHHEAVSAGRVVVAAERRRMRGQQLHQLRRVERAAPPRAMKPSHVAGPVRLQPGEDHRLGRIGRDAVEEHVDQAGAAEHVDDPLGEPGLSPRPGR